MVPQPSKAIKAVDTAEDRPSEDDGVAQNSEAHNSGSAVEDDQGRSEDEGQPTASLRHVLTQAIILQEFILELAASLQIRATLFNEVDLS